MSKIRVIKKNERAVLDLSVKACKCSICCPKVSQLSAKRIIESWVIEQTAIKAAQREVEMLFFGGLERV